MGHLVAATIVNTGVFAFLAFSRLPVYEVYELAPPVSGLSARDDQLLAGLLMKIGGAPILWTAISILFFRWYREQQREDEPPAAPALETATP
jgi:cytochrome c oxidase assembly factor CtaG